MMKKTTEELLQDVFRGLQARKEGGAPRLRVALISTPRCGSSMFCDVLKNTSVFGEPLEWFNIRYMKAWAVTMNVTKIDFFEYVNWVTQRTCSSNGLFSVNFHVEDYLQLQQKSNIDVMSLGFDKVYYLYRKDKLAQAYSLQRAQVTDQWSAEVKALDDFNPSAVRNSDILRALWQISVSEDLYHERLEQYVDMSFCYEDFRRLEDTDAFSKILADCDIHTHLPELKTRLKRQSGPQEPEPLTRLRAYLKKSDV